VIGQPVTGRAKGPEILWLLEDDTLTALNVFEVGGRATRFKLIPNASGMECTVESQFMQEVGAGTTKLGAPKGGQIEILEITQTGSSCTVGKE
jgi:hypothetical protein